MHQSQTDPQHAAVILAKAGMKSGPEITIRLAVFRSHEICHRPLSATPPLHARRGTALGAPAAGRVAGQPLTRGLEAVKTKTMRVTLPLCA